MLLRKATKADYEALTKFYQEICEGMEASGLHQWQWGKYPNAELVSSDIERGTLYCVYGEYGVAAAVTVETEHVADYESVGWIYGVKPGVFRRIAVNPAQRNQGLGTKIMADVEEIMRSLGCDSLRCDAYSENYTSMRMYAHRGLRQAGRTYFAQRPKHFICYEKPLIEDCPLLPIAMHPAFRGGKHTPWGGNKLLTVYDKPTRDVPTGESLEVSTLPLLDSTDDTGMRLVDLVKKYGSKLVGKFDHRPFPLVLKLIDAKQSLSVQVHPDDAFAAENEHGMMGKTEAWLILEAKKGSKIVCGFQEGTTKEQLAAAAQEGGEALESLLRQVEVKSGDVVYLPAGCVHAMGGGITLYEIQQTSDLTYRLYDWGRTDSEGKARKLHVEKALEVVDVNCRPEVMPAPVAAAARVLDEQYFTLDVLHAMEGKDVQVPRIQSFGILTALDAPLTVCWEGASHALAKGATLLLPATAPALTVVGNGRAALAMPK